MNVEDGHLFLTVEDDGEGFLKTNMKIFLNLLPRR